MRRLLAGASSILLLLSAAGCDSLSGPPDASLPPETDGISAILMTALDAQQDLYDNFWDYDQNHIRFTPQGYVSEHDRRQQMIWDHGIMIFSMYTLWFALEEDDIFKTDLKNKLTGQWEFMKRNFTHDQLTGNFGSAPHIAVDDSGWGAMVYMIMYDITGDDYALEVCRELITGAYDYWKDGDTKKGLWYSQKPPSQGYDESYGTPGDNRFKSMSSVGLMYAALEYTLVTGDRALLEDTVNIYNWTEENMLRNKDVTYENGLNDGSSYTITTKDNLYWMDFNEDRAGRGERFGPDGGTRPGTIREAGSVSCMFANTAMGAIHVLLYEVTQEEKYLTRAAETLRAFNDSPFYSSNGVYVNDRDAWANAMFIGPWVRHVLTLPDVTQYDKQRVFDTADSIALHCRTENGYWRGGWSGSPTWDAHASPTQIMTSATTVNMLTAAALLERIEAGS